MFGSGSMSAPSFGTQTPAATATPAGGGGIGSGGGGAAAGGAPPQGRLPDALTEMMDRMNPAHAECHFQAALYNKVDTASAASYTRPAGMQERVWRTASTDNPDPSRLVPVAANWFDDLTLRVDAQNARLDAHKAMLELIAKRLGKVHTAVDTQIEPHLMALRRRHRELARRLFNVAVAVELHAARQHAGAGAAVALSSTERERSRRVEALRAELDDPGKFKARLCDLADRAEGTSLAARGGACGDLRDARAARAVRTVLSEQLEGIKKLHDVCEKAKRDVNIVAEGLGTLS